MAMYTTLTALLGPVNSLFDLHAGGRRRPVFHDIAQSVPSCPSCGASSPPSARSW